MWKLFLLTLVFIYSTVNAQQIQPKSIDARTYIIDGTIEASQIKDSTITADKIATGVITSGSIADSSITSAKIATGTITSVNIGTGSVTTTGILDNTIGYQDLSSSVQSLIGGQLYDYQDASINPKLQILARWAHYLHERYYNESDYYYHTPYDQSGTSYMVTRRPVIQYISLLVALHEKTGKNIYWNKLTSLVSEVLSTCSTITKNGYTCYTVIQEAVEGNAPFAHSDVPFHEALYYIYTVDPTTYASYLTYVKNFMNVSYSIITKNLPGWGWGYTWSTPISDASTTRINVEFPWFPFWAQMKVDNITSTEITASAQIDTLIDSLYTYCQSAWVSHFSYGGQNIAGWAQRPSDVSASYSAIDFEYNTSTADLWRTAEILNDTAFVTGFIDSMQYATNYFTNPVGVNFIALRNSHNARAAYMMKMANKWGITALSDMNLRNWVASILYPGSFVGDTWQSGTLVEPARFGPLRLPRDLALLIKDFNDDSFNDDYIFPYVSTFSGQAPWSTNASSFYLADGYVVRQGQWIGFSSATPNTIVGYRTGDTSPLCTDTTNWVLSNDKVLSWTYPAQVNGLTYSVSKRMGSPFMKVVPSEEDSIRIETPHDGTGIGDSLFIFYYDQSQTLQMVRAGGVTVGDSITGIRGDLGIATGSAWVGSANDVVVMGFICNESNMRLIKTSDNTFNRKIFTTSIQTMPDSAIFYMVNHGLPGLLKNQTAAGDYTYPKLIITDILEAAQRYWNYGMGDKGILTPKTN